MLISFKDFVNESRGFSTAVGAYAELCVDEVLSVLDRYLSYDLSRGNFNFSEDIIVDQAYTKVSREASGKFPIDEIKIIFRISAVSQEEFSPYEAYYRRNYDKVKLQAGTDERVNIQVYCKLVVPKSGRGLDPIRTEEQVRDIFNHELLHAYQDYRDPNFLRDYRLGFASAYVKRAYPHLMQSKALRRFFDLLYLLTDSEISAVAGERRAFDSLEELKRYPGYRWAQVAQAYEPSAWAKAIEDQLAGSPHLNTLQKNFGQLFVEIYEKSIGQDRAHHDAKIMAIPKGASLLEVLEFFEPYIRSQGKKLARKLAAKLTQQGSGTLV